jgi:hypothetical protein
MELSFIFLDGIFRTISISLYQMLYMNMLSYFLLSDPKSFMI